MQRQSRGVPTVGRPLTDQAGPAAVVAAAFVAAGARGKVTVKAVPRPGWLSTAIVPPCPLTRAWAIASPKYYSCI